MEWQGSTLSFKQVIQRVISLADTEIPLYIVI